MKKFVSLLLALVLCLSLTVPALADAHALYVIDSNAAEYNNLALQGNSGSGWSYDEASNTLTLNGAKDLKITVNILYEAAPTIVLAPGSKNELTCLNVDALVNDEDMAGKDTLTIKGSGELTIYNPNPDEYEREDGAFYPGFARTVNLQDGLTMTGGMKKGDSGALAIKKFADEWNTLYKCMSGSTPAMYVRIAPAASGAKPAAPSSPAVSTGFTDVAASSPYAEAVKWAVEKGITSGITDTTFGPNNTCTYKHIMIFLWRAKGRPGENTPGNDQFNASNWAFGNGLLKLADFPDTPCTRAWAVWSLWIASRQPSASKPANFTDMPDSSGLADAISWAVEKGITSGTSATTFSPDDICTRGQIVTFLYRAMK